jgi:hypothetical protein
MASMKFKEEREGKERKEKKSVFGPNYVEQLLYMPPSREERMSRRIK